MYYSLSVDFGINRVEYVNEGDKFSCGIDNNYNKRFLNKFFVVLLRFYSISDVGFYRNLVLLFLRKFFRKLTLNVLFRERKYFLLFNDDLGYIISCLSNVVRSFI